MSCEWTVKAFDRLSLGELYAILRLRQQVFVVEQACAFLDADGLDGQGLHLCGYNSEGLVAYARLHASGVVREQAMIGRVLTSPAVRGRGYGRLLMGQAVRHFQTEQPEATVWLGAQQRLQGFYAGFGFLPSSEPYLEDGIWHIGMQGHCASLRPDAGG